MDSILKRSPVRQAECSYFSMNLLWENLIVGVVWMVGSFGELIGGLGCFDLVFGG